MGLLKIILAFVLLAVICERHQADARSKATNFATDCFGASCYSFHEKGTKWTENREVCKKLGGDLVSIETDSEWTFLKDMIQGLTSTPKNEWHIGLKKDGSKWKWVSGVALKIKHWQVSEGQPSGDGPYGLMAKDFPKGTHGLFNDIPDYAERGFICERIRNDAEQHCHEDSCYSFYGKGEKWTENREECKTQGGDLVSIETEDEWTFLKDAIQGITSIPKNEWHIGLMKEGSEWKWVSGAPLTNKHWQRGQPSGDGPYGLMAKDFPKGTQGLFNDISNWMRRGYICETAQVEKKSDKKHLVKKNKKKNEDDEN